MSRKQLTDDPRLTAYALGELSAADRAAVEQQIGDSVETLLEMEAIREVAGQLRAALQSEPALPLTEFVVPTRVTPHPGGTPNANTPLDAFSPRYRWSSRFAIATSCLALFGTFSWLAWSGRDDGRRTTAALIARSSNQSLHGLDSSLVDGAVEWSDIDAIFDEALPQRLAGQPSDARNSALWGARHGFVGSGKEALNSSGDGRGYLAVPAQRGRELSNETTLRLARDRYLTRLQDANVKFYYFVPRQTDLSEGLIRQKGETRQLREVELHDQVAEVEKLGEIELRQKLIEPSFHRPELLEPQSAEAYAAIHDNPFASPLNEPLSTFSIDVDTAAYSNMRRFLTQGSWPPVDSVRIEDLVNYFNYDYTPPGVEAPNLKSEISDLKSQISNHDHPFAVHLEVAGCPWNADHRLVRVGLKGKEIALDKRPVSNIVFLIDVSGSMQEASKLPLVKSGLRRLVEQLNENDRVGIVVYAGASGLVLDSTNATQKDVILSSIENLQAGGSTNGGEGIQLAYALARKHFIEKGTNRVILCTDGDFNVGITNQDDLTRLIEEESKSGVFLSVLGFGMGNLKDSTLEKLADKGNGNYAYIDTLREANKVFVEQMTGTLITIAKDVKIQIEFNPSQVGAYRLIGYENRLLAAQDFHDDTKDAGEIGAGHTVTGLFEIIPPSKLPAQPKEPMTEEKLKYQPNVKSQAVTKSSQLSGRSSQPANPKSQISDPKTQSSELLTIKLRYKQPDADKSQLIEQPLIDEGKSFSQASTDFRFAASVASFGMILRHSPHRGNATLDAVAEIAQSSLGADKSGYRSEFVGLVRSAKALQK